MPDQLHAGDSLIAIARVDFRAGGELDGQVARDRSVVADHQFRLGRIFKRNDSLNPEFVPLCEPITQSSGINPLARRAVRQVGWSADLPATVGRIGKSVSPRDRGPDQCKAPDASDTIPSSSARFAMGLGVQLAGSPVVLTVLKSEKSNSLESRNGPEQMQK